MNFGDVRKDTALRAIGWGGALGLAGVFIAALPLDLLALFGLPVLGGLAAAWWMRGRGGGSPASGPAVHSGYNMSRVGMTGGPGALVVLAFVWMFSTGVPGAHVYVSGMVAGGLLFAFLRLAVNRRRAPQPTSPLGLLADHTGERRG